MPNVYGRTTKISNAGGRSEYISNKTNKQEEVLVHEVSMKFDWQFYHEYELSHQHNSGQKQNEAREIMLPLPNELASKVKGETTEEQKEQIKEIVNELVGEIIGENHDYEYAVHWNKARTNLHCHIMFSEREVLDPDVLEQKTYAKDIWQDPITHKLTKKGVGELVHKKGDLMFKNGQPVYKTEPLSAKDTRFKDKGFMVQRDLAYQKVMEKHGYEFDINDSQSPYLSQKKLYQGASEDYISKAKEWNKEVKRYNEGVKEHIKAEPQIEIEYVSIKRDILDNVKEANRYEKKITNKAINMVKSMADYVQNKVLELSHKLENTYEHLQNWWRDNRENLMNLNSAKHTLKDYGENLEQMKELELQRQETLKAELKQAEKEQSIKADMKKYGINRDNAEMMLSQGDGVKAFTLEIANDIHAVQEKHGLKITEKQRLIGIVFDEPDKIKNYFMKDTVYDRSMYRDVKPIMDKLKQLHGDDFDPPRLARPIEQSFGIER